MEATGTPDIEHADEMSDAAKAALREQSGGKTDGREAVETAGKSRDGDEAKANLGIDGMMDATDWFLSDNPEESKATRPLKLDVTIDPTKEIFVEWIVQAVDRERIQQIRDESKKGGRAGRRAKAQGDEETDTALANLRIATEGTAYPNLRDERVRGSYADPADSLRYRFRNKSGLIDQIAVKVLEVSGYDEEDIQEITAVKT